MNRITIVAGCVGLALGVGLGRGLRTDASPSAEAPVAAPERVDETWSDEPAAADAPSREQALLLDAIHEIELTTSELDAARAELAEVRQKVDRYDWMMSRWSKKGSSAFYRLNATLPDLKLNKDMIAFLGLDEETAAALDAVAERTMAGVKDWETTNAIMLEETGNMTRFELPPLPNGHQDAFFAEARALLTPSQSELLGLSLENSFKEFRNKRVLRVEIIPANGSLTIDGATGAVHESAAYSDKMKLKVTLKRYDEKGRSRGSSTNTSQYNPDRPPKALKRWDHLISLDAPAP